jgi:hypothetical protein
MLASLMSSSLSSDPFGAGANPLDRIELLAGDRDWAFNRAGEDAIAIHKRGAWMDYAIEFSWVEHFEALHVSSRYEMRVPENRINETMRLLSLVNEQMLFGHFDLWLQDGTVVFRIAMPLTGGVEPGAEQIEFLVNTVLVSCERYYQALQHVAWAGQGAKEALANVLFDTVGEA